jgi:CRP/FNR family transcriptional regulator
MTVLRGIPEEALARLRVERVERKAGETFFKEGDPCEAVYGVLTGRVQMVKEAPDGRQFCLDVLGPGEVMAAVAAIRGIRLPATATALDAAACMRIPVADFSKLLEEHPKTATRMLSMVSKRLVEAGSSRRDLAIEAVEVRLARVLSRLAEKFGSEHHGEQVFSQSITRQNLADLAGTTVETTIRVMSRWTREGIVRTNDHRISIVQPARLAELAERPGSDRE